MRRSASSDASPSKRRGRGLRVGATAMRLHLGLVAGLGLCVFAGWVELSRARHGHVVAWVYVVEWPLFAVIGSYMWWRLLAELGGRRGTPTRRASGKARRNRSDQTHAKPGPEPDDPGLRAWQDYLADLHASDPPGGPPPR